MQVIASRARRFLGGLWIGRINQQRCSEFEGVLVFRLCMWWCSCDVRSREATLTGYVAVELKAWLRTMSGGLTCSCGLQIVDIRQIGNAHTTTERFRLVLSDGVHLQTGYAGDAIE